MTAKVDDPPRTKAAQMRAVRAKHAEQRATGRLLALPAAADYLGLLRTRRSGAPSRAACCRPVRIPGGRGLWIERRARSTRRSRRGRSNRAPSHYRHHIDLYWIFARPPQEAANDGETNGQGDDRLSSHRRRQNLSARRDPGRALARGTRARAAAEGRSVRYVILSLLEAWAEPLETTNARALENLKAVRAAARKARPVMDAPKTWSNADPSGFGISAITTNTAANGKSRRTQLISRRPRRSCASARTRSARAPTSRRKLAR